MARYFTFTNIPNLNVNEKTVTFNFTSNGDAFDAIIFSATGGAAEYAVKYRRASTQELLTVAVGTPFDDPTAVFTDILYATIYIPGTIDADTDEFLSANGRYDVVYFSGVVVLREMPYLDEYAPSHPEWAANFVSAGKAFAWIMIADLSNTQSIQYLTSDNTASIAYTVSEGWQSINSNSAEASRTLDFGDTPQIIEANLYTWLQENKEGGEEPTTVISGLRKWNAFPSLVAAEQDVAFTSRGTQFSSMRFVEGADDAAGIYYGNTQVFSVVSGWVNEDYRAFDFGATEQRVLASFYDEVIASSFEAATISGEWLWNSLISVMGYSSFLEPLLFTSNGQSFTSLQLSSTSLDYIGASNAVAAAYEDGLQTHERRFDERYRVMNIVGVQVIAKTVYNFISARASGVRPISGIWRFVSTPATQSIVGELHFAANFVSNGNSYTGMTAVYGGITYTGPTYDTVYNNSGWTNEAYRVVDFGAEQWISEQGYLWFTANANVVTESADGYYVINNKVNEEIDQELEGVIAVSYSPEDADGYAALLGISRLRFSKGTESYATMKGYATITSILSESGTRPYFIPSSFPAEVMIYDNLMSSRYSDVIRIVSGESDQLRIWLSANATPMPLAIEGAWKFMDRIAADDFVAPASFTFISSARGNAESYACTQIRVAGGTMSVYSAGEWLDVYSFETGWNTGEYGESVKVWDFGPENAEDESVLFSLLSFAFKYSVNATVSYDGEVIATLQAGQTAIVKCGNQRMKSDIVIRSLSSGNYTEFDGTISVGIDLFYCKDVMPEPVPFSSFPLDENLARAGIYIRRVCRDFICGIDDLLQYLGVLCPAYFITDRKTLSSGAVIEEAVAFVLATTKGWGLGVPFSGTYVYNPALYMEKMREIVRLGLSAQGVPDETIDSIALDFSQIEENGKGWYYSDTNSAGDSGIIYFIHFNPSAQRIEDFQYGFGLRGCILGSVYPTFSSRGDDFLLSSINDDGVFIMLGPSFAAAHGKLVTKDFCAVPSFDEQVSYLNILLAGLPSGWRLDFRVESDLDGWLYGGSSTIYECGKNHKVITTLIPSFAFAIFDGEGNEISTETLDIFCTEELAPGTIQEEGYESYIGTDLNVTTGRHITLSITRKEA